jgi:predicted ribosomally synthesized peptide with SipW-like signal peptide
MMHRLLMVLLLVGLIASQAGMGATAYFTDTEPNAGNTFEAWVFSQWVQTTQGDFQAGVLDNVDTSSSPGDVRLSLILNPTLVTSDNAERSVTGTTPTLVKTLTFTKSGDTYNELRIDSNLRIDKEAGNKIAYSDIHVNDVSVFTHSTQSATYVAYQDTLDFSGYADGLHTIKLYLYTDSNSRTAYNSIFELYRTNTYAAAGTIASQVLDTGIAGAKWDALFWGETLPANTDITFEVRASDTAFTKDAATPSWTFVGGTSPVTSGLPSGRYLQWRATLTTSDTSKTPTLHEVTVDYY